MEHISLHTGVVIFVPRLHYDHDSKAFFFRTRTNVVSCGRRCCGWTMLKFCGLNDRFRQDQSAVGSLNPRCGSRCPKSGCGFVSRADTYLLKPLDYTHCPIGQVPSRSCGNSTSPSVIFCHPSPRHILFRK